MVSTRQMTGATTEESTLYLFRSSSAAASSNNSSHPSATNRSAATQNHHNGISVTNATAAHSSSSSSSGLAVVQLSPHQHNTAPDESLNLLDLPVEILGHIFSFVGYKKVSQMRVISHQMNQVCSSILNSTFQKLQTQMLNRFQIVKAKMPRRESARRNHPLACECDILETCSMRLSLLQMTFGKHIERKHCCFFPGGILDEVYSVLNYIRSTPMLARPFKVTDELFDLSTMAMEFFREHLEPNLPDIACFTSSTKPFTALEVSSSILSRDTSLSSSSSPPQSNMVLRKGIRKIKQGMKRYNNQLSVLRSELRTCKRKATEQAKQIAEQQKLLAEQQKQTLDYANRLDENDKKNEEISRKFSTLLQELNKCKTELQYWRSKSPATPNCNACGQAIVAMPPEDLQALVNQGVRPEEVGLPVIAEEPVDLRGEFDNGLLNLDAQPMSPLPPAVAAVAAVMGSPRSQKRKYENVESASDDVLSVGSPSSRGNESASGPSSPLNPPFASIVASYSSSSLSMSAGPASTPPNHTSFTSVATGPPPSAVLSLPMVPSTCSSSHSSQSNLLHSQSPPTNVSPNPSTTAGSGNGSSSSDNVNYKKLRRVQNKARSHNNHNNSANVNNTNTKATRSKQSEK